METKTEADSTDITEHPHDDKSRPYVCTVCDKRFTQKCHMTEHRKRHTGENVYSCTQCKKRFSSRSALYSHKNIFIQVNTSAQNVASVAREIKL